MPDAEYIKTYGKGPHSACDMIIIIKCPLAADCIILVERNDGTLALPGGFMEPGLTFLQNAEKELDEETSITVDMLDKFHFTGQVYDNPDRDPRAHIVSHVYYGERKFGLRDLGFFLEYIDAFDDDGEEIKKVKAFDLEDLVHSIEKNEVELRVDHADIIKNFWNTPAAFI